MAVYNREVTRILDTVHSLRVKSQSASDTGSAFVSGRRKENWGICFVRPIRTRNSQWPDYFFSLTRWTTSKISVTYHKNPRRHTAILVSLRPILILSSHQLLYLQNWRFPSGFLTKVDPSVQHFVKKKTVKRPERHCKNNGRIFYIYRCGSIKNQHKEIYRLRYL